EAFGTYYNLTVMTYYINISEGGNLIEINKIRAGDGQPMFQYEKGSGIQNWTISPNNFISQMVTFNNPLDFDNLTCEDIVLGKHKRITFMARFNITTEAPALQYSINYMIRTTRERTDPPAFGWLFGSEKHMRDSMGSSIPCLSLGMGETWYFAKWHRTDNGGLFIENNEYYIKATYYDNITWTQDIERLFVNISSTAVDNYNFTGCLGFIQHTLVGNWNQSYEWYHVDSSGAIGAQVSTGEMLQLKNLLNDDL
ncbi:unnamed protein product, partial [marine sediment metagenome]